MKLSIIIPVYNVEAYLLRCLESCVNQDVPLGEYEIIIINDGSTDGSLKVAESFVVQHPHVTLISQPNGGLSAARNMGLRSAKGDYIWFVDSDDWITKDCLKGLSGRLWKDSVDILGVCKANVLEDHVYEHYFYNEELEEMVLSGKEVLLKGYLKNVCSPYAIYNRLFLLNNAIFFYEGVFHEDSEFTPRAYYFARKVGFYNRICYKNITRRF